MPEHGEKLVLPPISFEELFCQRFRLASRQYRIRDLDGVDHDAVHLAVHAFRRLGDEVEEPIAAVVARPPKQRRVFGPQKRISRAVNVFQDVPRRTGSVLRDSFPASASHEMYSADQLLELWIGEHEYLLRFADDR